MMDKKTIISAFGVAVAAACAISALSYGEEDPASIQHRYMAPSMRVSTNAWLSVSGRVERAVSDATNGFLRTEKDPLFKAWKKGASVAAGSSANANATLSVAIGADSQASDWATAVGYSAKAVNQLSTSIGYGTYSEGVSSVAIGSCAYASDNDSVAIGKDSFSHGVGTFNVNATSPSLFHLGDRTLQSFLDEYWKKTDYLVNIYKVEIKPEGFIKCPDYMGTDETSVCFSANGNDIIEATSYLYPDGTDVVTAKTLRSVIDTKPATMTSGCLYSFRPSASSNTIAIIPSFEAGLKGIAEAFLDFSEAAPAVTFRGTGITFLYVDGSLKPSDLAASNRYMMELKWFSTNASGTRQKYMIINIYNVAE